MNVWNQRNREIGSTRKWNPARPWYQFAKELLSGQVTPPEKGRIALDVGCGTGEFMLALTELGFIVEGVDGCPEQMERVSSLGFSGKVANLEEGLPYPSDSFSLVTCLELIEHIGKAEFLLDEIHRILGPGGCLLLSTPNFSFLNNRLHYLLGRSPCNEGIHLRFFIKRCLESVLTHSGFTIIRRNSYGLIPFVSTLAERWLGEEPLLWRVPENWESLLAYDFVYLARKEL